MTLRPQNRSGLTLLHSVLYAIDLSTVILHVGPIIKRAPFLNFPVRAVPQVAGRGRNVPTERDMEGELNLPLVAKLLTSSFGFLRRYYGCLILRAQRFYHLLKTVMPFVRHPSHDSLALNAPIVIKVRI